MGTKYAIRLKGTNCFLKSVGSKSDFTTDIRKAKVFESNGTLDIIDKLNAGVFKVRKESCETDSVRLTMDKSTWQMMCDGFMDQIQTISDSRRDIHQYSMSLVKQFETKSKAYRISQEFPNLECTYYGEDFERVYSAK
jgi:hypothetical protein